MKKYRVLDVRGIEHNHIIYFPLGTQRIPAKMTSGANGQPIATNVFGVIELEHEHAEQLVDGQIPFENGKPVSIDEENNREAVAKAKAEAEAKAAEELAADEKDLQELLAERRAKREQKKKEDAAETEALAKKSKK
jgi:hypothetical protein